MRPIACLFASLLLSAPPGATALALASPAESRATTAESESKIIDDAWTLIREKKPGQAIALIDPVIAAGDRAHAGEQRQIYCASSPEETLMYMLMAANEGKGAIAISDEWCRAIFLKGFALIDLNRPEEAKPLLDRAVAMAPMNAQYLAELGEWHKGHREWDRAYQLFEQAEDAAAMSRPEVRNDHQRRALRGMGYVLIEQGKLDEAEKLFRKCLELDPNDQRAKTELEYIRQQRQRLKERSS
jgi:tetratricopeptide (TPR) repeat protein